MGSIKMALEAIMDKKGRSFLTMLGIIIGVGAVLILVTVVQGYNADITAYYEKLGVNKVGVEVTYYDRTNTIDVTDEFMQYVSNKLSEHTVGVTPDIETSGTLKYMGNSNDTADVFLGNEQWSACNNFTLNKGRDILTYDLEKRERVCVIGSYVAESLFGYINPVGETITFNGDPYVVIGTFYQKDGTTESSMDDMILIPYTMNRVIMNTDTVTEFTVKVDTSEQMDGVMAALEDWFGENLNLNTASYDITDGNEALTASEDETASISLVLGGVAGIALLVGGIGIMNIMLVTVTERTREIGIKKAIGAQRKVIISQFLVEASVLSATGGLIGIIIGYIVSLVLSKAIYDLLLVPSVLVTIGAALFSIIIGVCFGLYPAVKASGLQPVDALRSD